MRPIGRPGTIDRHELVDTLLDPDLYGRTVAVNVDSFVDGGITADEGTRVRRCRVHQRFRQGLYRDCSGRPVLNPMLRAADNLVAAASTGDARQVHRSALAFFNTRCFEMSKELGKVAGVRNANSAMLVGVCAVADDIFVGDRFLHGSTTVLQPWQIGLGEKTMQRLGLSEGDVCLLSRYPTTRVVPVGVARATGHENVVHLPAGKAVLGDGTVTSLAGLVEGDLDGDCYVVRTVKTRAAKAELEEAFDRFWSGARAVEHNAQVLTWKDHVDRDDDPERLAYEKCLQKTAVGSLTLDWYACFVYLSDLQARGVETELTLEDIREMMTDSLESCFDLKHSNNADPMTLHAMLLGMKSFEQCEESLRLQGLDVEKLERLARMLGGRSVRDLASSNPAFAVCHTSGDGNAVQRLVNLAPDYRPLEFLAAMMAAAKHRSRLSYDLVTVTARNAKTLAEVFRDALSAAL